MTNGIIYQWIRVILQNVRVRQITAGITLAFFAIIFPFAYRVAGQQAGSLISMVILFTCLLFGTRGGLIAWVITVPLYVIEVTLMGHNGLIEAVNNWPGIVGTLILTVIIGMFRNTFAMMWQQHESDVKINEDRLRKINNCFLTFEANPKQTIKRFTLLAGELLDAECALYTRVENDRYTVVGFLYGNEIEQSATIADHHLCQSLADQNPEEILIIRNFPESPYRDSLPIAISQELRTYAGKAVRVDHECVGALCVMFGHDVVLGTSQLEIMGILASAIAVEEKRRRVENALRESEERFRTFYQKSSIGLYRSTPSGELLLSNSTLLKMLGYSSLEEYSARGNNDRIFEPADDRRHFFEQVEAEGEIRGLESAWKRTDGAIFYIRESARAVRDVHGKTLYYDGSVEDITERKQAEEALRASEERFRRVVESSPVPMHFYRLQTDNRLVLSGANPAADRIIGIRHLPLIGQTIEAAFPGLTSTNIPTIYRKVAVGMLGAQSFEMTYKDERFSGLYDVKVFQVGINTIAVHFIDITERKLAEAALRENETRLRTLIATAPIGIVFTQGGIVLDANPACLRMFGYTDVHEVQQLPITNHIIPQYRDEVLSRIGPNANVNIIETPYEVIGLRKDGTQFPFLTSVGRLSLSDGPLSFCFLTDLTEQKNSEAILRDVQRRESLGVLSGGIAHDFNNLFGIMLGNISLAQHHLPANHVALKNLAQALSAMERAAELIQQMLAYSGKGQFDIRPMDLAEGIREHVSLYKVSLPKNVKLELHLPSHPLYINGDPRQIEQIIMNLITNGGEAIGEKQGVVSIILSEIMIGSGERTRYSSITGSAMKEGRYVCVTVQDNGGGMSREIMHRIFDPFFTTKFTGRGLGLSAVLGIIRGHEGGLSVESTEGKGTIIKFVLPAIEAPAAAEESPADVPMSGTTPFRRTTVLVIDDEPDVATMAQEILESRGYTALVELNPVRGIELYKDHRNDIGLVLLDLTMPEMSGKDVADELNAINPAVRIIITSGYSQEEIARKIGTVKFSAFIQKPYRVQALLALIERVLK